MTIYIDEEFKCHTSASPEFVPIETNDFDGKCRTFIEGCRYVPEGETWMREDGTPFTGPMVAPWIDYSILDAAQQELDQLLAETAQYESALAEIEAALGVTTE